jgi:hypothetical protein
MWTTLEPEEFVMDQTALDDVVAEIGRDLVSQLAPAELILYRAKSEAFFKDRPTGDRKGKQKDEMLGIGTAEMVTFLTPVILYALQDVLKPMVGEAAKRLGEEAGDALASTIRKLFGRPAPVSASAAGIPGLTQEQLTRAHATAVAAVLKWKRSPEQARRIADAIVASLATAKEAKPLGR